MRDTSSWTAVSSKATVVFCFSIILFSLSMLLSKLYMQRSTSRPYATAMILRQALHDRQSNSRYHTYPQVTESRIAWVALAKRLVAQDEMLFTRCIRMLSVRCALAKRYFRTRCMRRQATGARGGAGQPAGPASQILL